MNPSDQTLEAQRKQKQNYLKAEIIDQGFEGADFAAFLNSVKEGGTENPIFFNSRWGRY
jgi:anti-sigma regulatory factor (Ser/Thr protein kinase)